MTLREQYELQKLRAHVLSEWQWAPVEVWVIKQPGIDTRVSIIGHAVTHAKIEQVRAEGGRCRLLTRFQGGKEKV